MTRSRSRLVSIAAALIVCQGALAAHAQDLQRHRVDGWQPLVEGQDEGLVEEFRTPEYRQNWALDAIRAAQAYALLRKNGRPVAGKGVVAVVSDKGVDFQHPDLAGRAAPEQVMAGDGDGHGTHIAGSIAGARDGVGMHGVAFEARILAVRETTAAFADAARRGDVKVINASWSAGSPDEAGEDGPPGDEDGPPGDDGGADNETPDVIRASVISAARSGAVIVVSLHQGDETRPGWPAELASDPEVGGCMITVAGAGTDGRRSSHATTPDLAAWTLLAPGEEILAPAASGSKQGPVERVDERPYHRQGGTSMATPQVAGAVCVLRAAWPELTAQEAVQALLRTATPNGDPGSGRGRLDLWAAVQALGSGEWPADEGAGPPGMGPPDEMGPSPEVPPGEDDGGWDDGGDER